MGIKVYCTLSGQPTKYPFIKKEKNNIILVCQSAIYKVFKIQKLIIASIYCLTHTKSFRYKMYQLKIHYKYNYCFNNIVNSFYSRL